MKIVRTFGIVLALHVVGGLLFFQPGCQTQPRPQTGQTAPATGGGEPLERLDWETEDRYAESSRPRSAPTRPSGGTGFDMDEPVLQPLPSSTPAPYEPVPSAPASGGTYTVRSGDSLWVIANRNNVSLRALLDVNGLTENSVIHPGQELLLPAGSSGSTSRSTSTTASAPAPEGTTTYVVRSGDSLSVIAQRHGTTVSRLKDLNNMTTDVIRIDQRLIVPERSNTTAAPRTTSSAPAGNGPRHTVKSGETPGGIAAQYGITAAELMSANNISDPRRMRVGQELVIPGAGSSGTSASAPAPSPAPAPAPAPAPRPRPAPAPEPVPVEIEPIPFEDDTDFPIVPIVPSN